MSPLHRILKSQKDGIYLLNACGIHFTDKKKNQSANNTFHDNQLQGEELGTKQKRPAKL